MDSAFYHDFVQYIYSEKRGARMTATKRSSLTLMDFLNAANEHYDEQYLSKYFDVTTGGPKAGSGDTLAKFIVCELRESFDGKSSREQQVSAAVLLLERAKEDIQNAIMGLLELEPTDRVESQHATTLRGHGESSHSRRRQHRA
jgi:hypothetical protein